MRKNPITTCPDCHAIDYPECSAKCEYCKAVRVGNMNTLEDRLLNPKLNPGIRTERLVPTNQPHILLDFTHGR